MAAFLIDSQLPPGLARKLKRAGHEAVHVFEIGLASATDRQVRQAAIARKAILITKDEDFITMANLGKSSCPVLWIRFGNTTNKALWASLEPGLPEIIAGFEQGELLIELG
jgi:predicted nuclease of predicted toxin-antitoxin system